MIRPARANRDSKSAPAHRSPTRRHDSAPAESIQEVEAKVKAASGWLDPLSAEISRVIVGQQYLVDRLLVSLLTGGHTLLEGLPGLAKTLSVKTLAATTHGSFKRLQFTPDMLPADVIGTLIYSPKDAEFQTRMGPIFANFVLADEINRAPAKVQSALLEAMAEGQVTIGDVTHALPSPFLVLATQNPVDQEGTYSLPEAQLDRFLLKLHIEYPSRDEEREILDAMASIRAEPSPRAVVELETILSTRDVIDEIYIDGRVRDYIVSIILATRDPAQVGLDIGPYIRFGASPRGTIGLTRAARAWAFLCGRAYVSPADVKAMAADVLRHRIGLTYEGIAHGVTTDDVVETVLGAVPTP